MGLELRRRLLRKSTGNSTKRAENRNTTTLQHFQTWKLNKLLEIIVIITLSYQQHHLRWMQNRCSIIHFESTDHLDQQIIEFNRSKSLADTAILPFFDLSSWSEIILMSSESCSSSFIVLYVCRFVFLSFCIFVFLTWFISNYSSQFIFVLSFCLSKRISGLQNLHTGNEKMEGE